MRVGGSQTVTGKPLTTDLVVSRFKRTSAVAIARVSKSLGIAVKMDADVRHNEGWIDLKFVAVDSESDFKMSRQRNRAFCHRGMVQTTPHKAVDPFHDVTVGAR